MYGVTAIPAVAGLLAEMAQVRVLLVKRLFFAGAKSEMYT
jgi:hypothetical protein